jgi:hypothetical protein
MWRCPRSAGDASATANYACMPHATPGWVSRPRREVAQALRKDVSFWGQRLEEMLPWGCELALTGDDFRRPRNSLPARGWVVRPV